MVLAGDDISADDAFLRGPFFSLHGHSNSRKSAGLPLGRILGFCSISCLESSSSWAWGAQVTLSPHGFLQFVAGWLAFTSLQTSQPSLTAARPSFCCMYYRTGSHGGPPAVSHPGDCGFPAGLICERALIPQCGARGMPPQFFQSFDLNLVHSPEAL